MSNITYGTTRTVREADWRGKELREYVFHATTVIRSDVVEAAEEEFMRTFVSKYFLPKKISQARKRGAVKVAVPLETMEKLVARIELQRSKGVNTIQVGVDNLAGLLQEAGVAA